MKERRLDKRFKEENKIILELCESNSSNNGNPVIALTTDISIGGTRILTDKHYPVGTDVKLILTLSRSRQTLNIGAKVIWIRGLYGGNLFEMGLEFKHDTKDTILCLLKHLYGKGIPTSSKSLVLNEKSSPKPPQ